MSERLRILLIDDDEVDRMAVVRALVGSAAEMELEECDLGRRGLELIRDGNYDCVLLDYHLPDLSGLELLDTVRGGDGPVPAVIVMTGEGNEMVAVEAMKRGASDYLPKKRIEPEALLKAVRGAVERNRLEGQLAERTRQLETSVAELRRKNAEIETYAGIVSRDLREKEELLREVYHRVKNNLQVVQSLINMSSRRLDSEAGREALATIRKRVQVIAMVHERLYRMPDLAHLSLPDFLRDVVDGAIKVAEVSANQVELEVEADPVQLTMEKAIPLGLLVNELISNSLKHGLADGRRGAITLRMLRSVEGVHFSISDDGQGLPEDFEPKSCESMGMQLAISFARQLGGELHFRNENGCRIDAEFNNL